MSHSHDRHKNDQRRGQASQQQRTRIAQVAAELILNHGLTDWSHAKRKAARQLQLPENNNLPDEDEIRGALLAHQAIFSADNTAFSQLLRKKREQALSWMERFSVFSPRLFGSVAEGWAGEHQDIHLMILSDDSKAIELDLINRQLPYQIQPPSDEEEVTIRIRDNNNEIVLHVCARAAWLRRSHKPALILDKKALMALIEPS